MGQRGARLVPRTPEGHMWHRPLSRLNLPLDGFGRHFDAYMCMCMCMCMSSSYVMSCHCHIMLCHVTSSYITSHHIISHHIMLHHITSHHITSYYAITSHTYPVTSPMITPPFIQVGPEHLEIITADAEAVSKRCTSYGAVFIGSISAEVGRMVTGDS